MWFEFVSPIKGKSDLRSSHKYAQDGMPGRIDDTLLIMRDSREVSARGTDMTLGNRLS